MATVDRARLGKYTLTILKDRSATDLAKVAAAGATINAYVVGATVRTTTTVNNGATTSVPIYDPGDLRVGDTIQLNGVASPAVTVQAVQARAADLSFSVSLTNSSGSAFITTQYDRLIVTSRRPTLYKESKGIGSFGGSSVTADLNGFAEFYARGPKLDLVVSYSGLLVSQVIANMDGGDEGPTIDVRDYGGSIKLAVAAYSAMGSAVGPGRIYVPAGVYTYGAADMNIDIPGGVEIYGDGPASTLIQVDGAAGDENADLFRVRGSFVKISGMQITGVANVAAGTGRGIVVGYSDSSITIQQCHIDNMRIFNWSSYGMEIGRRLDASLWSIDHLEVTRCTIGGSRAGSVLRIGGGSTMIAFRNCGIGPDGTGYSSPTGVFGIWMGPAANVLFDTCDGSPPDLNTIYFKAEPYAAWANPYDGGADLTILNCDFEGAAVVTTETAPLIHIDGWTNPVVMGTLLYQMGSGLYFKHCYGALSRANTLKDLGGSGYHLKLEDTWHSNVDGDAYEFADDVTNKGKRKTITITFAGANAGWRQNGSVLHYITDAERDTGPAAATDDKRPALIAGAMAWVTTPTAPTSRLQVYTGAAWVNADGVI